MLNYREYVARCNQTNREKRSLRAATPNARQGGAGGTNIRTNILSIPVYSLYSTLHMSVPCPGRCIHTLRLVQNRAHVQCLGTYSQKGAPRGRGQAGVESA